MKKLILALMTSLLCGVATAAEPVKSDGGSVTTDGGLVQTDFRGPVSDSSAP